MHILVGKGRTDRDADKEIINKALMSRDPVERRQAQLARDRINNESHKVASMREALVRAHRSGNKDEIADIHDFIGNRSEYKNGW